MKSASTSLARIIILEEYPEELIGHPLLPKENIMAAKKYLVGTSDSRKSSLIQKILPTQFSLDEDQEFSNIGPENNSGKNFIDYIIHRELELY